MSLPDDPTILLVEDDDDIRDALREVLQDRGYSVITADNGQVGLEKLESSPRPDLILLDLMMPVMNGEEFLEAIRGTKHSQIPVVAVSAWPREAARLSGRTRDFVAKPVSLKRLLSVVDGLCA